MNQRKLSKSLVTVVLLFTLAFSALAVKAIETPLTWNGGLELAEVKEIATEAAILINEMDAEIALLDAEILILENNIIVLEAERDALIVERDALIIERDALLIDLSEAEAEVIRLEAELTQANLDAENTLTDICAEVSTIRNPVRRARFDTWCP